jgi:transcriptional regulator
MYGPAHFKEERIPVLHDAIRRLPLANLVTLGSAGLTASAVPLLLDAEDGPFGTLRGHLARPNPQARDVRTDVEALAIFMGPDAYISPNWYATKRETGKVVPTWNYVTVHAHGPIEFFDDPAALRAIVEGLTTIHEAKQPKPWAVDDAPADFIAAHLKGIIGFRIPITRLEGKWKMSQNRPAEDRSGVVQGLEAVGDPGALAAAALVAARGG